MNLLRNRFRVVVVLFGAVALIFFSVSLFRSAKVAAQNAANAHAECLRFVDEIKRFRDSPRIASLDVEPPDRIAARVTSAAANSELSPASIVSVDPQSPVRIGRTEYQIRATQIALQNASLRQIAGFVSGLEEPSSGMIVRDLSINRSRVQAVVTSRLTRVAAGESSELWNVRLTLTQMIFSPISGR